MTLYRVYDVFTDHAFGGNQLAVFPDANSLDPAKLQAIAREFNFSETTFVYPAQTPETTARVRIFTPTSELQFAGHPTIGTAICLRDLGHVGEMVLELGVGPIPCVFEGDEAAFTTAAPLTRLGTPDHALVARALGLETAQINNKTHPPTEASLGTPFVLTELVDRAALSACQTNLDAMREGASQSSDPRRFAVLAYVRDGNRVDARMFAPLGNIPEDPATGSAAATLAALLHQTFGQPQDLTIHQGEDMGRPSLILAATGGTTPNVTIRGRAVLVMEGHLLAGHL